MRRWRKDVMPLTCESNLFQQPGSSGCGSSAPHPPTHTQRAYKDMFKAPRWPTNPLERNDDRGAWYEASIPALRATTLWHATTCLRAVRSGGFISLRRRSGG